MGPACVNLPRVVELGRRPGPEGQRAHCRLFLKYHHNETEPEKVCSHHQEVTEEGHHTGHASHTLLVVSLHFLWLESIHFSGEVVYLLSLNSYCLKILSFSELQWEIKNFFKHVQNARRRKVINIDV